MKVLIDGKEYEALNAVKVILTDVPRIGQDPTELHLTITDEGLITDLLVWDEVHDTNSVTHDETVTTFMERGQ